MNAKKILVIAAHAMVGWMLCGSVIAIGFQFWDEASTMIVHAIAVPIIYIFVAGLYFWMFAYTTPLQTATIFLLNTILLDFFLVSMLIRGDFEMFTSLIGTWIPFATIFITTYAVGKLFTSRSQLAVQT